MGECRFPRISSFNGVAGSNHQHIGNGSKRGDVFNGLVSGSIFSEADRIVTPNINHGKFLHCSESDRGLHVIREAKKGGHKMSESTVVSNSIRDPRHCMLANTVMDISSRAVLSIKRAEIFEEGIGRAGEIGVPVDEAVVSTQTVGVLVGVWLTSCHIGGVRLSVC